MIRPLGAALLGLTVAAAPGLTQQSRPERTGWKETSSLADVWAFLDTLRASGAPIRLDTLARAKSSKKR